MLFLKVAKVKSMLFVQTWLICQTKQKSGERIAGKRRLKEIENFSYKFARWEVHVLRKIVIFQLFKKIATLLAY